MQATSADISRRMIVCVSLYTSAASFNIISVFNLESLYMGTSGRL